MPNPFEIPQELKIPYQYAELNFPYLLNSGQLEKAREQWEVLYQEFLDVQNKEKRRLNKGGILHNLGIINLARSRANEAFEKFIFAYVEDVLNSLYDPNNNSEETPAAKALRDIFAFKNEPLTFLKEKVIQAQEEREILDPVKTFGYFIHKEQKKKEVKNEINAIEESPLTEEASLEISKIPGNYNKRVFVGGNYSNPENLERLRRVKNLIIKLGYTPIMVADFKDEGLNPRRKSLILLHNCLYAVFDLTAQAGQLIELDRCKDYETDPFVFVRKTSNLTNMIDLISPPVYFESESELDHKIEEHFSKK